MTAQEANALLDSIAAYITRAVSSLNAGDETLLRGMEEHAQRLIEAAVLLSPQAREQCVPRIEALSAELLLLEKALKERRTQVGAELSGMGQLKRANAAYRSAETAPKEEGE